MYYVISDADIQWLRDELGPFGSEYVVDLLVEDAHQVERCGEYEDGLHPHHLGSAFRIIQ